VPRAGAGTTGGSATTALVGQTPIHLASLDGVVPPGGARTSAPAIVTPHSPRSSFPTRVSDVKSLLVDDDDENGEHKNDTSRSSASSSRARLAAAAATRHERRPSLVQSDDGFERAAHGSATAPLRRGGDGDDLGDGNSVSKEHNSFCVQLVLPAVCQGGANFAENMDIFMACRHPLDNLLGMFHEGEEQPPHHHPGRHHLAHGLAHDGGRAGDSDAAVVRVSGYHAIPTACEYCGSSRLEDCDPSRCQRPASFFPKLRPPFCKRGGADWDVRDFAIGFDGDDDHDDEWNYKAQSFQPKPAAKPHFGFHFQGLFGGM
jgi:hypothetical protein